MDDSIKFPNVCLQPQATLISRDGDGEFDKHMTLALMIEALPL
jgi:hypothetical protein